MAATRLAAAARAACDADADTLSGRLRRCVPAGRRFDKVPSAVVVMSELREHASRIGVPLPADCVPVPTASNLRGDDAAARTMLTTYVESLEAAFGSDIIAAPRGNSGRTSGKTPDLLNWLWTVPAASASATAAAAVAAPRIAAAARAARDADADTLPGRLRRCVPIGRGIDATPPAAVIVAELHEHAFRIGVPLPTDCGPAPTARGLRGDDAAARSLLTTYVETLEAAFGDDIITAPRCNSGRTSGKTPDLLNWLWTVPAASASVVAAAAVTATRLAAAAKSARDADADTLPDRLRHCVPVGRGFNETPPAAVIVAELHEHASRIGVPLPTDCGPAPFLGSLTGDDAAARVMLTTYAETLEAAFGNDIIAAPRENGGRNFRSSHHLLNWLWTVPAASDSAAVAGPSSARAAAAGR